MTVNNQVDYQDNFSWRNFVPTYLMLINNFFSSSKGVKKILTLFVEGKADKDFYDRLFPHKISKDEVPQIFMGNFYKSKWLDADTITLFGNPYLKADLQARRIKYRELKDNVNELYQAGVYNCKFVEEVGRVFGSANKDGFSKFNNIEGFAFADRDFNSNDYVENWKYNKNNLAYSFAHDYETTIFYLFLPFLCESKQVAIDIKKLGNLLWLTAGQGYLEKFSIENPNFNLQRFSNYNFFDDDKWPKINEKYNRDGLFDFDAYIDDYKGDKGDLGIEFIKFKDDVLMNYYNNIIDWVKNKKQSDILTKLFCLSNGHFLWKQFVQIFGKQFDVQNDSELTRLFMEYIVENQNEALLKQSPVKEYLEFYNNFLVNSKNSY